MNQELRKSLRLPGYDYSQNGVYFITICTEGRYCSLSSIVGVGVLCQALIVDTLFGMIVDTFYLR